MIADFKTHFLAMAEFVKDMNFIRQPTKMLCTAGGAGCTLAALKLGSSYFDYNENLVNHHELSLTDIKQEAKKLASMSKQQQDELVGTNRAELILVGSSILEHILEYCQFDKCMVFDVGLVQGLLVQSLLEQKIL